MAFLPSFLPSFLRSNRSKSTGGSSTSSAAGAAAAYPPGGGQAAAGGATGKRVPTLGQMAAQVQACAMARNREMGLVEERYDDSTVRSSRPRPSCLGLSHARIGCALGVLGPVHGKGSARCLIT